MRSRRSFSLRAAAGGLAAAAAVLVVATAATAARSPGRSAAAGCPSSGLVVWLDTQSQGAAGHLFYNLKLTNLSGHACTLRGYPGVSAVDLRGHQIGSAAVRDTTTPARLIRLSPGGTASALLRLTNTGVFSRSACGQVTAAGFRVFPPNATSPKIVPFPFGACSRRAVTYLAIRAVR
jgi:hypothetical protein